MMHTSKFGIALLLLVLASAAHAESVVTLMEGYASKAARNDPGFTPSAERGHNFFTRKWGHSHKMPNCKTCHGDDLTREGKHVITGKRIDPLSPKADPERFTDLHKAEKWFRRNCKEVVGRECTDAEKADLLKFFNNPGVKS